MSEINELLKPLKTWSHLAKNRRRPTEYEIVSTNLLWTTADPEAPFAMGKEIPISKWMVKYRNQSPLKHPDWDGFRDPDQMIYRTYNTIQDGQESYVDGLLEDHQKNDHDSDLSQDWLATLAALYTPGRYLIHTVQLASSYLVTMAPASTIVNCFIFQAGDQLRWVSRIAYRTAELANAHPEAGFNLDERSHWENDEAWQGFRELTERALIAWDWGEQFTAFNLVIKPAIDAAFLGVLGRVARKNNDSLTGVLADAQMIDSERSKRWVTALLAYVSDVPSAQNQEVINKWVAKWEPLADRAIDVFCAALDETGQQAEMAKRETRAFRVSVGLTS